MNFFKRPMSLLAMVLVLFAPGLTACKPTPPPSNATVVVQAGDSFYRIANRVGVDPLALAQANGMTFESVIHPGDVLKVPGASTSGNAAPPTTKKKSASTTTAPPTTKKASSGSNSTVGTSRYSLTSDSQRAKLVELGKSKVGSQYVSGEEGPDVFDCSGLVNWLYNEVDVPLPRERARDYARRVTKLSLDQLKPGDLVFFTNIEAGKVVIGHVGINIGGGKMVEAANKRDDVRISTFANRKNLAFAGRL